MSKIVVCFPGIGYHCDKPLLYYSRNLVHELGYKDSRNVSYTYKAGNIRGNEEKMKEAYEVLFSQAEDELADIAWSANDDFHLEKHRDDHCGILCKKICIKVCTAYSVYTLGTDLSFCARLCNWFYRDGRPVEQY